MPAAEAGALLNLLLIGRDLPPLLDLQIRIHDIVSTCVIAVTSDIVSRASGRGGDGDRCQTIVRLSGNEDVAGLLPLLRLSPAIAFVVDEPAGSPALALRRRGALVLAAKDSPEVLEATLLAYSGGPSRLRIPGYER